MQRPQLPGQRIRAAGKANSWDALFSLPLSTVAPEQNKNNSLVYISVRACLTLLGCFVVFLCSSFLPSHVTCPCTCCVICTTGNEIWVSRTCWWHFPLLTALLSHITAFLAHSWSIHYTALQMSYSLCVCVCPPNLQMYYSHQLLIFFNVEGDWWCINQYHLPWTMLARVIYTASWADTVIFLTKCSLTLI